MVKRLSNPNEVIASASEPERKDVLWIDTDEATEVYTGTRITVSATEPSSPQEGDLWVDLGA